MKSVKHKDKRTNGRRAAPARRFPAGCTVISRNDLSFARVLASSYVQHHAGARFYVLVVDRLPEGVDSGPGIQLIDPSELYLPYLTELCFKYTAAELCAALKPTLLKLLLNRHREQQVVYFDSDFLVMRPLEELTECLASADIVLMPHLLSPPPLDGLRPDEQETLQAGVYNAGFFAVRDTDEAHKFLRWWQNRLHDCAILEYYEGLFADHRWLDLAPSMFNTTLFKDDTYNVSYWNIDSRPLGKGAGGYYVNGRPLAAFHFRGVDAANPETLSKYQNRTPVVKGAAISDLIDGYVKLQI